MSQLKKRRHRRKLYAGGAMMVLAPLGVGGCDVEKSVPLQDIPPDRDVVGEVPDGYVNPDVIAIAPFDPGPLDADVPEFIAIAPIDLGFPQEIAIVGDVFEIPGDEDRPEVIAIAPFDPGPGDPGGPMLIVPADVNPPETVQPGTPCDQEGTWCSEDLRCQPQAICILPTECCGGCECEPVPCNPAHPACPPGSECVAEGDKGHCVNPAPSKVPGGFMAPCETDDDCLQEYFCQQTIFCIAPPPGDGRALPDFCNQKNCVPFACQEPLDKSCPPGSQCAAYGTNVAQAALTCVRKIGEIPGGFGDACSNSKECIGQQYFCHSGTNLCIVPCDTCQPLACDPDKPSCPEGSQCEDAGITSVCVKKT